MAVGFDLVYYSHHQLETSIFEKEATDEYEAYIDRFTLWQYLLDLLKHGSTQQIPFHCFFINKQMNPSDEMFNIHLNSRTRIT